MERSAHFLGRGDLGGDWSTMRVLTNPEIKIFHANLVKHVFIDLNQLPDPLNDVQTSFGGKVAPPNHHHQTPDPLCINPCTRVKHITNTHTKEHRTKIIKNTFFEARGIENLNSPPQPAKMQV